MNKISKHLKIEAHTCYVSRTKTCSWRRCEVLHWHDVSDQQNKNKGFSSERTLDTCSHWEIQTSSWYPRIYFIKQSAQRSKHTCYYNHEDIRGFYTHKLWYECMYPVQLRSRPTEQTNMALSAGLPAEFSYSSSVYINLQCSRKSNPCGWYRHEKSQRSFSIEKDALVRLIPLNSIPVLMCKEMCNVYKRTRCKTSHFQYPSLTYWKQWNHFC